MSTTDNITVFENLSDNIISFESKEQFMRYYDKNKDDIDNMATRGLNTKFKIDGYKIGRKNKQLILFPIRKQENQSETKSEDNSEEFNQLNIKIDILTDKINKFDHVLKQILKLLSELNQDRTPEAASHSDRASLIRPGLNNPEYQSPSSYTSGVADIFVRTGQNSYR